MSGIDSETDRDPRRTVVARVKLQSHHVPTGRTHHVIAGEAMAAPAQLRVTRWADDAGFYLMYCDAEGQEMTDTWHETLEKAFRQAQFEFGVTPAEWDIVERQ